MEREKNRIPLKWGWNIGVNLWFSIYREREINIIINMYVIVCIYVRVCKWLDF